METRDPNDFDGYEVMPRCRDNWDDDFYVTHEDAFIFETRYNVIKHNLLMTLNSREVLEDRAEAIYKNLALAEKTLRFISKVNGGSSEKIDMLVNAYFEETTGDDRQESGIGDNQEPEAGEERDGDGAQDPEGGERVVESLDGVLAGKAS